MEFTIKCDMEDRWVPHFLAMLDYMEHLGNVGSSRKVGIYADGDGDFRPKFWWPLHNPDRPSFSEIKPKEDVNGNRIYDAG